MACRQPEGRHGRNGSLGIDWKTPGPMPGPAPFCARESGAACRARPRDRLRSGAGIPGHSRQSLGLVRTRPSWRSSSWRRQHRRGHRWVLFPGRGGGLPYAWYRQGKPNRCCSLAKRQAVRFARQNRWAWVSPGRVGLRYNR
jgi:hypothetical protein